MKHMKRHFVCTLTNLILIGLLGTVSISLAGKGAWTEKAPMHTARSTVATCVVDGKIYAIGGWDGTKPLATVEVYDPITDTWTKKAPMPTARCALSASVVNGKIYVFGGQLTTPIAAGPRVAAVEEYDPVMDTWTKKSNLPSPRAGLSSSAVDGVIYVFGGWPTLRSVEAYDTVKDNWKRKAGMPTRRGGLSTSVVEGKIYAIGGGTSIQDANPVSSAVEVYDPLTDTWSQKTPMPTARDYLGTSVVNGKIYAVGGFGGPNLAFLPTAEVYDVSTDTWKALTDMPTAKTTTMSAVGGQIYAIGGGNWAGRFATVEVFDTGFIPPRSVDVRGKRITLWGNLKVSN